MTTSSHSITWPIFCRVTRRISKKPWALARKAKEQVPESPEMLDTLGWLYYRKGLYDLAAKELEQALAKADWPAIQFHLGLTYNRLGNTEKGGVS